MKKLREQAPLLALAACLLFLAAWRWPWSAKLEKVDPNSSLRLLHGGSWESQVLAAKRPVLVEFGANWCPSCRAETPLLEDLAKAVSATAVVGKVDIDDDGPLARRYGIEATPTILVFKEGEIVANFQGYTPEAVLRRALEAAR